MAHPSAPQFSSSQAIIRACCWPRRCGGTAMRMRTGKRRSAAVIISRGLPGQLAPALCAAMKTKTGPPMTLGNTVKAEWADRLVPELRGHPSLVFPHGLAAQRLPRGPVPSIAFIATAFAQEDAEMARTQWRQVADQLRPKVAKLALLMDQAEADVLAFMSFPKSLPSRKRGTIDRRSTAPIHWNGHAPLRRTRSRGIGHTRDCICRFALRLLLWPGHLVSQWRGYGRAGPPAAGPGDR